MAAVLVKPATPFRTSARSKLRLPSGPAAGTAIPTPGPWIVP